MDGDPIYTGLMVDGPQDMGLSLVEVPQKMGIIVDAKIWQDSELEVDQDIASGQGFPLRPLPKSTSQCFIQ